MGREGATKGRPLTKQTIRVGWAGIVLLACFALTGSSGTDDLRIHNNYSFAIRLRYQGGELIGTVPARGTRTFEKVAGLKGSSLDHTTYENERGKTLGRLSSTSPTAKREHVSRFNGTAIWSVTVGP